MLCDTCYWKVQCGTYIDLKPGEEIKRCIDEYGGLEYVKDIWYNK